MKTVHAAATPLSGALCGNPAPGLITIPYKEFVRQGNSKAWDDPDEPNQRRRRRCRTCLKTARVALGMR